MTESEFQEFKEIAIAAMQGLLANGSVRPDVCYSEKAIIFAKEMQTALNEFRPKKCEHLNLEWKVFGRVINCVDCKQVIE
jgi:hypothetical protein